jgi:hypothetical protein
MQLTDPERPILCATLVGRALLAAAASIEATQPLQADRIRDEACALERLVERLENEAP